MESVDVCVKNPKTKFDGESKKYTAYEISLETNSTCFALPSSNVRRQYYEFKWLRKQLQKDYPYINAPKLPPNLYFSEKFDPSSIAHRMKGLERFLQECMKNKSYRSNATFHLFLQSDLPFHILMDHAEGKCDPDFIEELWKNDGKTQPNTPDFWDQFEKDVDNEN